MPVSLDVRKRVSEEKRSKRAWKGEKGNGKGDVVDEFDKAGEERNWRGSLLRLYPPLKFGHFRCRWTLWHSFYQADSNLEELSLFVCLLLLAAIGFRLRIAADTLLLRLRRPQP